MQADNIRIWLPPLQRGRSVRLGRVFASNIQIYLSNVAGANEVCDAAAILVFLVARIGRSCVSVTGYNVISVALGRRRPAGPQRARHATTAARADGRLPQL